MKTAGESRYLSLTTGRAILTFSTSGCVRGHNASGANNAFSVAATRVKTPPAPFVAGETNFVETFSGDGPRRVFFDQAGNPMSTATVNEIGGPKANF